MQTTRIARIAGIVGATTLIVGAIVAGSGTFGRAHNAIAAARPALPTVISIADVAADGPAAGASTDPQVPLAPTCQQHAAGDFVESVLTPDGARSYRIHVPVDVPAGTTGALPLVLNYHGSGQTAAAQELLSGLVSIADREHFILVGPEGSLLGGESGWDIPGVYHENGVDDVAASLAVIAQVEHEGCVDTSRVFAIGISNGAQMAAQMACRAPGRIAAFAAVSGIVYQGCDGAVVPAIVFHGTADQNIDYAWGWSATQQWAKHDGCTAALSEDVAPTVSHVTFEGCAADVEMYTVEGGGHTWPGTSVVTTGLGLTTHEIGASELAWAFFATHPKG